MEWETIGAFLEHVHGYGTYLIMRNYEELLDKGTSLQHADIDVLCDDARKFISYNQLGARTTDGDTVHRKAKIGGVWVAVDVREIGDGYFDRNWERAVLDARVANDGFYVMAGADYFYTLLYHACVNKRHMPPDYQSRLKVMAEKNGIAYRADRPRATLEAYMRSKRYRYEIPADGGVVFDLKGADRRLLRVDAGRILDRCGFWVKKAADKGRRLIHG